MVQAGQYVTDGTAVFIVTDIRDGAQVGDIKLSPVLRKGYVKANGALLVSARANYPRLVTFVTENPSLNAADDTAWASNKALYVYNSSANTLRVPDATGRVLQGGSAAGMLEAGLPNITGRALPLAKTGVSLQTASPLGALHVSPELSEVWGVQQGYVTSTRAHYGIYLNSSMSNPIYGSSTTVQPPALTMIPQIKY